MAVPTFKDELDDLPVTPKATATPAAAATSAVKTITVEDEDDGKAAIVKTAKSGADDVEDLSVDFGDRELMKKTGLLERLRPEKGKAVRFAMLTDFIKARSAFTHFIDKKGTFRCLVDKLKRTKKDAGGDPEAEGYCFVGLGPQGGSGGSLPSTSTSSCGHRG